jgi:uncharacterized membrane protein
MDEPNRLREDLRRALHAAKYENVRTVEEARPLVRELLAPFADQYDFDDPTERSRFMDDVKRVSIEKVAEQEHSGS